MIDWNKPIEAVEKATGRVVPMTFKGTRDSFTGEKIYMTTVSPADNSNDNWHGDGRDWCVYDAWVVRNVAEKETLYASGVLTDALASAMSPDAGETWNETLYCNAKDGWMAYFAALRKIGNDLPTEEERNAFTNAMEDSF